MRTIDELRNDYAAAAHEYHALVMKEPDGDDASRSAEEVGKIKALGGKLTNLEFEIGERQKAAELDVENMFAGKAAKDGKSVDQQTAEAYNAMDALHDLFKSKVSGLALREDAAQLLSVDPQTLKPIAQKVKEVMRSDGKIVNIDIADNARGGYSVPDLVDSMLTSKLEHYSVMRRLCDVQTSMTGRKITFVTEDDTGNIGEIVKPGNVQDSGARGTVGEQGRTFGAVELEYNVFSSKRVSVDREYIMDTATPSVITDMAGTLGERIGRAEERAFANGDGTGVTGGNGGIANCDNAGYRQLAAQGQTQVARVTFPGGRVNVVGDPSHATTGNTVIRVEDWANLLLTAIDESYWADSMLLVRASTLAAIWFAKDAAGRPAYMPSLVAGEPGMFLGRRVMTLPELEEAGAASRDIAVLFDPKKFKIRDVTGFELKIVDSDTTNVESYMQSYYGFARCGFAAVTAGDGFAILETV